VLPSEQINRKIPCPTKIPHFTMEMPLDNDKDGLSRCFFELSSLMVSPPRITKQFTFDQELWRSVVKPLSPKWIQLD